MSLPPLQNERFAHLVIVLERQFRRSLERRLEPYGVLYGHWIFLRILWDEEGLSQRELANRAGLATPTVHSAIKKMESLGLVERIVPKGNNIRPLIYLTPHARALRAEIEPLAVSINDIATQGIPESSLDLTKATILEMIKTMSKSN